MTDTVLRIALENVDFRLPTQVTDDNSVLALKSLAFEPLVRWQPNGHVAPGLFASWENSNAQDWTFNIREGAVFHDGEPCTADDIVAYIKGFLDSRDYFGMSWSYARYFARTTFEAEGDKVVRIRNAEPFADLLNVLNDFWPSRLDKQGKPIIGTGLYRVTEFERRDGIGNATLQLIDPSQSPSHPKLVIAVHEPNGEKRLQLLRDGHVDAALNLERVEDLSVLDFAPSLSWGRVTSTLSAIYYLNCTNGIFSSPEARLAVNLAVDNIALVKEVYQGFASPSATVVSPFHLGFRNPVCNQFLTIQPRLVRSSSNMTEPLHWSCVRQCTCPSMLRRSRASSPIRLRLSVSLSRSSLRPIVPSTRDQLVCANKLAISLSSTPRRTLPSVS